jgi:methylglutaconyl-CoA hydratase
MPEETVRVQLVDGVAHVTLNRPDVRNAFNAATIVQLRLIFDGFADDPAVRAVVLRGEGKVFCGGADVNWMRASLDLTRAENVADAQAMSDTFRAIDCCPKPVVACIHGAALGGGSGLVAVCDIAISADDAVFGFTETKLGIIPAVISPFVIAKIGTSHARALFLTGERFSAQRALAIALVHVVVPSAALGAAVDRVLSELRTAGPNAVAAAKKLIADVRAASYDASRDLTTNAIASQRISPEGQEGLRAFLDRRPSTWSK